MLRSTTPPTPDLPRRSRHLRPLRPLRRHTPWLLALLFAALSACAEDSEGGGDDLEVLNPYEQDQQVSGPSVDAGPPTSANRPPLLQRVGDRRARVGELLEIQLQASDPDNDPISFHVRSMLPEGAKFEKERGLFTWMPLAAQEGMVVLLTFEASDGQLRAQETMRLTVVPTDSPNAPPHLDPLSDQPLTAGEPFALQLVASDPDGDPLQYSMGGEVPEGATLSAASGLFQWTPPLSAAGARFALTFTVSDGQLQASQAVNLIVRSAGGGDNLPPVLDPIGDRTVSVGQTLTIELSAQDEHPDQLQFSATPPLPEGATFEGRTFTWTPSPEHAHRAFDVTFKVSDGEFVALERISIQVLPAGAQGDCSPAQIEGRAPQAIVSGQAVSAQLACAEGDSYRFNLQEGQGFTLGLDFELESCDLDLYVYNREGVEVASSLFLGGSDFIARSNLPAGPYTILVRGDECAGPDYTLLLNRIDTPCANDPLHITPGNHSPERAASLGRAADQPLTLCPGEVDYFYIDLEAGARFEVQAHFQHSVGDLDLYLDPPQGAPIESAGVGDQEAIVFTATHTGRHYLRVTGWRGASADYTLDLKSRGALPSCTPNRTQQSGTTQRNPYDLPPDLYSQLSWCGENDWYATTLPEGHRLLEVYITHSGEMPQMAAYDSAGQLIAGAIYRAHTGEGCEGRGTTGPRDGCARLSVVHPGSGRITYTVQDGQRGQAYDLRVRTTGPNQCSAEISFCDHQSTCDSAGRRCQAIYCSGDADCPAQQSCVQGLCITPCIGEDLCKNAQHSCKQFERSDGCVHPGDTPAGGACGSAADCQDRFECRQGAGLPGGLCTLACDREADCGGGVCGAVPGAGHLCGQRCFGDDDCRAGYRCRLTEGTSLYAPLVQMCLPQ